MQSLPGICERNSKIGKIYTPYSYPFDVFIGDFCVARCTKRTTEVSYETSFALMTYDVDWLEGRVLANSGDIEGGSGGRRFESSRPELRRMFIGNNECPFFALWR
jgi:hypothetical protein